MGMNPWKIGFVGTDGRTLLAALETSRATSELYPGDYRGLVVRGTPAMPAWARRVGWPVDFLPVTEHAAPAYAEALLRAFREGALDAALVMPESLVFEGLVDLVAAAGQGGRIIGLSREAAFVEADKIACKRLCREAGIPVAPAWAEADAHDYRSVLGTCLEYLHEFGGAVLKYPYAAGGKGARIIGSTWEIRDVYELLLNDYREAYRKEFGKKGPWPLLIESRMAGVEISFTILVDKDGHHRFLPTAMDYPERFAGPPGLDNPITGGMGSISPHPLESPELLALAEETIARPLIAKMRERGLLRQCVLYPGCFVSFGQDFKPTAIRVCEINIRPGEPEFQPVVKRLRNLGPLLKAMVEGRLDEVAPEVQERPDIPVPGPGHRPRRPQTAEGLPLVPDQRGGPGGRFRLFRQKEDHRDPFRHGLRRGGVQIRRLPGGLPGGQRHRQGRAAPGPGGGNPAAEIAQRLRPRQDPGHRPGKTRRATAWTCAGTSASITGRRNC